MKASDIAAGLRTSRPPPIRAQLASDICTALGITAKADAPVLALCRKLVDAGHDPATPLEVYRGDMLALRVKPSGRGAQRQATGTPPPVFTGEGKRRIAPPLHSFREAAE